MSRAYVFPCAALFLALLASPVHGQSMPTALVVAQQTSRYRPPPPRQRIGVRAFAFFDVTAMAAVDTFDAVLGSSRVNGFGAGGEVTGIWKGLFARVEASSVKKTGSRVLVVDDTVVPLDIPITVEMKPVEFGAGWRSLLGRQRRADAYVGGGAVHLIYRETSSLAGVGENTDTTFNGFVGFGGVNAHLGKVLTVGGEVQFRSIPNAIGTAGASKAYGETDLGGVSGRVTFGVVF